MKPKIPKPLKSLLKEHEQLHVITNDAGKTRIHCQITGHELVPQLDIVQQHIATKRYQLGRGRAGVGVDFESWKAQGITLHKHQSHLVFCVPCKKQLNRRVVEIEIHLKGKKHQHHGKEVSHRKYLWAAAKEWQEKEEEDPILEEKEEEEEEEEEVPRKKKREKPSTSKKSGKRRKK